ncbi:MAG: 2-C-methyl-D-erythritol 2,4-cyclodiphosphate synthase [Planctomycetaceae bacterium]
MIDALLGASGNGDIGGWFPNTDPRWKDADSAAMLDSVISRLRRQRWRIENLDCTISAEQPRLEDWKPRIRMRLAELLDLEPDLVNVKAKSGEKVGPIGRGEAIAADVVVLLSR